MTKISVIILNWNRREDLSSLLKDLKKQTFKNFEVIVVDNGSEDDSVFYIKENFPSVNVIKIRRNLGVAAKNYGFKAAKGKYLVALDSDLKIHSDCIEKFLEKLERNRDLGLACASVYDFRSKKYLGPNRSLKGDNKLGFKVCFFNGSAVALKKEVFEKIGGYSRDYFICLEELEWAVRILGGGFDIRCFTDIVVYNRKSDEGSSYRGHLGYYYCRNWIWFYVKYLPLGVIPGFLKLHIQSFFTKTGKKGTMRKIDCLKGFFAGIPRIPKYLKERQPVSRAILERIKLGLFPNPYSLYVN